MVMIRSRNEQQQKQEKLRQVISSIVELKRKKQEFQRRQRSRQMLVSAIRGTFLAAFWFIKYRDQEFADSESFDSEQASDLIDAPLADQLFHDFFDVFAEIELEDVDMLVVSINLNEITLFDLEATQAELNGILAVLS
jgi:hypothetical protein